MELEFTVKGTGLFNHIRYVTLYVNQKERNLLSKDRYFCLADCYDDFKDNIELYKQMQLIFQANISYIEVEVKEKMI